jgi:putative Ca2+/H+ antiporter (TMEM165/GDT1 family)
MLTVFLATYGAVFIAEIVGDKLLYTSSVLATRYRWASVASGMALAFMAKMAAAVAIGAAAAKLLEQYRWLVALVTASSFIGVALVMFRKPDMRRPKEKDARILQGATVAFATIFFSEWFDVGMMTAAAMAVKYVWSTEAAQSAVSNTTTAAVLVWFGAVLAMVTKGTLAVTLGASVRGWIAAHVQPRIVRYFAVTAILVLGTLAVLEVLGIITD